MGNQCLASTPNQKYSRFLEHISVSELKDLWQTVKVYKIKTIFEEASQPNPNYQDHEHLSYSAFKNIFPELENYPEQQIQRLFEFFDVESQGFVDWNSFFSALTICYFGSDKDLAVVMFMMFDNSLDFELDKTYLTLMIETNESFLKEKEDGEAMTYEEVVKELSNSIPLHIEKWLKVAEKYFDFSKFRKIFNVFLEEKMEKELVKHFHSWNVIFNEERQKYVGYLINLKWFESWRIYIDSHYGVDLNIYNLDLQTLHTIKTCKKTTSKSLKNSKMGKSHKNISLGSDKNNHGLIPMKNSKEKSKEMVLKNFDCIHGHLGERPRDISNQHLEGEFQEVLRDNLSENMDYIVVSEKVWGHLKTIYGGYPEFRRTGFDSLQLYPKVVCIYLSLFKGFIDYSTQVLREVSSYLSVQQMLIKSCDVSEKDIEKKTIFFKTIGMKRWQLLDDPSYLFAELSSELMIFLVCLSEDEKELFQKNHQKSPKDPTEVNSGDILTYSDSNNKEHKVVFMGKSTEGKYILHFIGESYSNDICLMDSEMIKKCKLSGVLQEIEPQKRIQSGIIGLPSGPGLGFINTVVIQLFNNKELRKQFKIADECRQDKFFYSLAKINNLLAKQCKLESSDIKLLIEVYLNKYKDFSVAMCKSALNDIYQLLSTELKEEGLPNSVKQQCQLELEKSIACVNCGKQNTIKEQEYIYSVIIPEEEFYYLEVVWVPLYTHSTEILKYVIKISKGASLGDFMTALETELDINQKLYVLTEVHGHDIVKNFNFVKRTASLQDLKVRESDKFIAFELSSNFYSFVSTHFSNRQNIHDDQIKKDMFIDCKHEDKGWIFGKVVEMDYLPYTQAAFVKVIHKFNKNQSWEIIYNCFDESIARFPLKSHKNSQQFHIKTHQRIFNEVANSMQLVNIPLVITIPSWMRWKEFFFFVYLQVKRLIADSYSFDLESTEPIPTSTKKQTVKSKGNTAIDKFKQYKNSQKFPYSLRLVDYEGRCVVCLKFVKSKVFKGQNDTFCEGCDLSQSQPISWQIKPADVIVCIDWKGNDRYRKDYISNSKSVETREGDLHKQQSFSLTSCLSQMRLEYTERQQFLCCNVLSDKKVKEKMLKTSDHVVIFMERIIQEEDGFKKVISRPLKIVFEGLIIGAKKYNLVGLTSIKGENFNIRYKTYTLKAKNEWYQYDGPLVRIVDNKYVEKQCALVLYYQRADK